MSNNRFKFIVGFPKYAAHHYGYIVSYQYREPKILKTVKDKDGYLYVRLWKNKRIYKKMVHRLIAETLIPNPWNKPQVNHKNGIRDDNSLYNLEWCTAKENVIHSYKVLGKCPTKKMIQNAKIRFTGKNNPKAKIDYKTVLKIRTDRKNGIMLKNIAKKYNLSVSHICNLCTRNFWDCNIHTETDKGE